MYFLLHHATGVLVLQAESREQALTWSHRQLAVSNAHFSIIEWHDLAEQHEAVERSGTGIREVQYTNSETKVNVMWKTAQNPDVQDGFRINRSELFCNTRVEAASAVIH